MPKTKGPRPASSYRGARRIAAKLHLLDLRAARRNAPSNVAATMPRGTLAEVWVRGGYRTFGRRS